MAKDTERLKTVLNMRIDGCTYQEIADTLGITRQRAEQMIKNFVSPIASKTPRGKKPYMIFPRLRELTRERNYSVQRISEESGISCATLRNWLSGKTPLPLAAAIKIKETLRTKIPLEELFAAEPKK